MSPQIQRDCPSTIENRDFARDARLVYERYAELSKAYLCLLARRRFKTSLEFRADRRAHIP